MIFKCVCQMLVHLPVLVRLFNMELCARMYCIAAQCMYLRFPNRGQNVLELYAVLIFSLLLAIILSPCTIYYIRRRLPIGLVQHGVKGGASSAQIRLVSNLSWAAGCGVQGWKGKLRAMLL